VGGVIIFFDNQIFFEKIEKYCPLTKDKIAELAFASSDLVQSFDRGEIDPKEFYSRAIKRLEAKIGYKAFYAIYNDVFSLNTPVLKTLAKLKGDYRLLLLSNTDIMRFGFIKKNFPKMMIFDEYILSYEVGFMKPHPRIYREALKRTGVEAQHCIFIDDRIENIVAASELGIKGILFEPHTDLESALQALGLRF
jgi:putative hydrolase of the HAD superfamily